MLSTNQHYPQTRLISPHNADNTQADPGSRKLIQNQHIRSYHQRQESMPERTNVPKAPLDLSYKVQFMNQ